MARSSMSPRDRSRWNGLSRGRTGSAVFDLDHCAAMLRRDCGRSSTEARGSVRKLRQPLREATRAACIR